jgi:transcriptional regulator with XRE-family HTH domain
LNDVLKRIKDRLNELNVKRPWLADRSGISVGTINSWYNNDRVPELEKAVAIAQALGVSVDWLATGKDAGLMLEDETIAEIVEYLQGLTPNRLQQFYGMTKLAMAMSLTEGSERAQNAG